ncbi:HAD family hydrolase [Desulfovibrio psychrotolerans]|uniref:phosphoglycolate phosphatase n=1 Tax=Desulfovibrio psychrotolerans TaxID=415242 RepID=A0A7J0BWP7_9BACT|nr:HAD family hydrolase [Desulfovibrio psychrotolerans]GFM38127.1 haloacid dehalogenase [Desulfovibrio psychrotolerans]
MPVSLIVFDCDGVILESVEAKTHAFGQVVAEFGPEAVARLITYHNANGGVSRYKKFEWFYAEVLDKSITEEQSQAMGRKFEELSFANVMSAPMVPGALEAIRSFHGRIPMYVASGAPHEELNVILKERGLSGYFEGIYGSPPGKTELLRLCIERAGVQAAETLMVGDSSTDLKAAEANGTLFYGRGKGFADSAWPWGEDLRPLFLDADLVFNHSNR